MTTAFEVPVYKYINGKREQIGLTNAEYLQNQLGEYIIDPDTQKAYVVPAGYKLENTIQQFLELNDIDQIIQLLEYKTNASRDLQKQFNGKSLGGFVPAFTPIASFDVGLACRAAEFSIESCKIGGGIVNYHNYKDNKKLDITGEYFNNPKNVRNMENANQYFDKYHNNRSSLRRSFEEYFELQKSKPFKIFSENHEQELELNQAQFANFNTLMLNLAQDMLHLPIQEQDEIRAEITKDFMEQVKLGRFSTANEIKAEHNQQLKEQAYHTPNQFGFSQAALDSADKMMQERLAQNQNQNQSRSLG